MTTRTEHLDGMRVDLKTRQWIRQQAQERRCTQGEVVIEAVEYWKEKLEEFNRKYRRGWERGFVWPK